MDTPRCYNPIVMSETFAAIIKNLRNHPLAGLAVMGLAGTGLAVQLKDSTSVEVAAVGASNTEQAGANEALSRQAEIEYGDNLLKQAKSGTSPLARAECNRTYYFTPKAGGSVIQVHKPISANRSSVTQAPNVDVPEPNKFFVEYRPVTDPITGEVERDPDGIAVRETRPYDPDDYDIRYEPLSSVTNSPIDTCVVALKTPDDGDPDVYATILAPDYAAGYTVSIGGITFAEPETNNGLVEVYDGEYPIQ